MGGAIENDAWDLLNPRLDHTPNSGFRSAKKSSVKCFYTKIISIKNSMDLLSIYTFSGDKDLVSLRKLAKYGHFKLGVVHARLRDITERSNGSHPWWHPGICKGYFGYEPASINAYRDPSVKIVGLTIHGPYGINH